MLSGFHDSKRRVFHTLDGLRGLAAIAVVARHTNDPTLLSILPGSHLAVDLFFVLSGFVLAHAYGTRLEGRMNFTEFMRLRLIRLYPLYILGTAISAALFTAIMMFGDDGNGPAIGPLLISMVFGAFFLPVWQSASADIFHPYPFNFPAWSLWWELLVNAAFAFIAPYLSNRMLAAVLTGGALLLGYYAYSQGGLDAGSTFKNFSAGAQRIIFSFFAGVAVHRIWASGRLAWLRLPSWGAALVMFAVFVLRPHGPAALPFDFLSALVIFPALVLASTREPPAWLRPTYAALGSASYAMYALHAPILHWVRTLTGHFDHPFREMGWQAAFATTLVIIPIALLADRLYDAPVRRFISMIARRRVRVPLSV